jgi:hypothetical protein
MTLVSALQTNMGLRLHDTANSEISAAQLITFLNMAVDDIKAAGYLIYLEESESLVEVAGTYSFAVPAGFAYINKILREDTSIHTYDNDLDVESWRLALDGGVPTLFFNAQRYNPSPGAHLKIVGQSRPVSYAAGGDTIDTGLEAVIREGALYYAFQFVAAGRSEYAMWRQQEAQLAYTRFQQLLSYAPQQFRMKPNSRYVPTR